MSLRWAAPARELRPPETALAFYSPMDYEDQWERTPIQSRGAEGKGGRYGLLGGVHDSPMTSYDEVGIWETV